MENVALSGLEANIAMQNVAFALDYWGNRRQKRSFGLGVG